MEKRPEDIIINLLMSKQITQQEFKILYEPFASNYKDREYLVSESGDKVYLDDFND